MSALYDDTPEAEYATDEGQAMADAAFYENHHHTDDEGRMAEDLAHLEDLTASQTLIADVKAKVAKMKELQLDMIAKEAAFDTAKEKYETYKATVVIASMVNAGVHKLEDENGNFIKLESKYHCNPNKNDEDRRTIEKWLKEHNGAHLLNHKGELDAKYFDALKENGIPFADKTDVNTNKLKAWLIDSLGYKPGSMARFQLNDIPECMHFVVHQEVIAG